jgi:hypothetical protein
MVDTSATNEVGQKVDFNQQRLDLADTRGFAAPGAVGGAGVTTLAAARLLRNVTVQHAGPDLVVTGYCVG